MPNSVPQLEILAGSSHAAPYPPVHWYQSKRMRIFLASFLLALCVGQAVNFSRPAVYQSSATVLTVMPPAVDESSQASELDMQHVAIQRQLLLGSPLLGDTLRRLQNTSYADYFKTQTLEDLRSSLFVDPVSSTHLVKMGASGPAAELLPRLVNTWIDAYLAFREEAIHQEVGNTLDTLREQYEEQSILLTEKRETVSRFRTRHDILTQDRQESQAHNRLKGLNNSLNKAREELVTARADVKGIRTAIEQNEPIVPDSEKRALAKLRLEAQALREKLSAYKKRFTNQYAMVEPEFKRLPQELGEKEADIERTVRNGRQQLLVDARQRLLSAQEAVVDLEDQLYKHKLEASEFSARFAEYQALEEDLNSLEELQRGTERRRAQIESKSLEKYPQVQVVNWAFVPIQPIHPDYLSDALIITAASLLFGIFLVWISEYLHRTPESAATSDGLPGIHIYSEQPAIDHHPTAEPAIPQQSGPLLAAPHAREITPAEVASLWRMADAPERRFMGLLLSGLTPAETQTVTSGDFAPDTGLLQIHGSPPRSLTISPVLAPLLVTLLAHGRLSTQDAEASLQILAVDAGIAYPEQLSAEALRHSYILYLVRQGARLRDLPHIIGPIPPQELAGYGPFSIKGPGKSLQDLETAYPLPDIV